VDIVERIRLRREELRSQSPLDFLFTGSSDPDEEEVPHVGEEEDTSPDLLNLHHVGEMTIEELGAPSQKEVIELNTESPDKIRYLKLIVALLESSNYDAAISAVAELSEHSDTERSG